MPQEEQFLNEQQACYLLTFNVVDWTDIFIKPVFKQIIVESLNYFSTKKGLIIYGWCLMSNHLHLIAGTSKENSLSVLANEFKKFTTRIIEQDMYAESETRRKWILKKFREATGPLKLSEKFRVWQTGINPVAVDLKNPDVLEEQLEFIHNNPVRNKIVARPEDYLHSSAKDYAGTKGLVHINMLGHESKLSYAL
jgi:REP element-mobilizing transposase RayT